MVYVSFEYNVDDFWILLLILSLLKQSPDCTWVNSVKLELIGIILRINMI